MEGDGADEEADTAEGGEQGGGGDEGRQAGRGNGQVPAGGWYEAHFSVQGWGRERSKTQLAH